MSVLGQAPLGGCEAPPSPLSFKLMLVVPGRIENVRLYLGLGLGIVGYLIPVCSLASVESKDVKLLSWMVFIPSNALYGLVDVRL